MRYFFHVEDGAYIRDPKGEEFADDAAAMREAAKVAQELSKLRVHAYEWRVVVQNADGIRVGSVSMTPTLAEHTPGHPVPPGSVH
jgi:histidinol phosphatase-like enzyme